MQGLSSPTRDQTLIPCSGSAVLITGLPENFLFLYFKFSNMALFLKEQFEIFGLGSHTACIHFFLN